MTLNREIAAVFKSIADMLEIKGENRFRVRAYRRAAMTLEELTENIDVVEATGGLEKLPGIGKDLSEKISEYLKKNRISFYDGLKQSIPESVLAFMRIPGVGPRTAGMFYNELGVKDIKGLARLAKRGGIKHIPGMGEKRIENILKGIDFLAKTGKRRLLSFAIGLAGEIVSALKKVKGVTSIAVAGSLRRWRETVRDIDIVTASGKDSEVMDAFVSLPIVERIIAHGKTKSSVITRDKMQVDLRIVKKGDFGACLAYMTGSKAHNLKLREIAAKKGLKLNEYGLFNAKSKKKLAGRDEKAIYKRLGLFWIPPELREDRGEIKSAADGTLPNLIELSDIKADLHVHTDASDGSMTMENVIAVYEKKRYSYVVITEHSVSLKIAGGLDEKTLFRRIREIDKINKRLKKLTVLKGAEVDILADGALDYPDNALTELDFVVAAVHSGFKQPRRVITARVLRAMENKYVNMLAHPTGRLIGIRDAYDIDMEAVIRHARETNTALEINAYPERLDLNDVNCRMAKENGVMLGISTDAHIPEHFENMRLGISVARRGWLEKANVLNTLTLKDFLAKIKK